MCVWVEKVSSNIAYFINYKCTFLHNICEISVYHTINSVLESTKYSNMVLFVCIPA